MYVDSHVHFHEPPTSQAMRDTVRRAVDAGVRGIVAVGGEPGMNRNAIEAAHLSPGHIRAAVGLDRDQAARATAADLERLAAEARADPNVTAIGEIGLDFHYSADTAAAQVELFRGQLAISAELGKPVVVHSREADAATVEALREHAGSLPAAGGRAPGVLHCFTGDAAFLSKLLDLGFLVSFSGIVTFRNADALREVARRVPEGQLMIETDTPYLAPVPYRGRPNEPAFVVEIARRLAEVRGVPTARIAEVTARNARHLFGLPAWD